MTPPVVCVEWDDAWFEVDDSGNRPAEYDCKTVGFLLEENEKWVRLAGELIPGGHRAVTHIPRACVRHIEWLTT